MSWGIYSVQGSHDVGVPSQDVQEYSSQDVQEYSSQDVQEYCCSCYDVGIDVQKLKVYTSDPLDRNFRTVEGWNGCYGLLVRSFGYKVMLQTTSNPPR
jgi:hypothetical protein